MAYKINFIHCQIGGEDSAEPLIEKEGVEDKDISGKGNNIPKVRTYRHFSGSTT